MGPVGDGTTHALLEKFPKQTRKATLTAFFVFEWLSAVVGSFSLKTCLNLASHYETKSLIKKFFLRKMHFSTSMLEFDTVTEHIN